MSTAGIFNSSNLGPNQACRSFSEMILKKMPNGTAPLFALTSQLKRKVIKHHVHTFGAKDWQYPQMELTSSLPPATPGSITTVSVTSAALIVPNQLFQVFNGEQVLVVNVPNDTHVTVQRGVGGIISPTPVPPGTILTLSGNAHEEASLRPQPVASHGYEMDNITQIFRNTWALTGTVAEECVSMGEHPYIENKAEGAMRHAMEIEMALWFGRRYSGVKNGQPFRTMSGFFEWMSQYAPQNISVAGAQTSYNQLEEMLEPAFDIRTDLTNNNDRVLFAGSTARKVINRIGREFGQIQMAQSETSFGMRFERFKTVRGEFVMLEHPLFNTNAEWSRMAVAMDLSSLSLAYLGRRDTIHKPFNKNVNSEAEAVDNGIDAEGGTFLSELTAEFAAPEANAVIYGLCEAACEPCKVLANNYSATFYVSNPCVSGKVAPNSQVTLYIVGAAPNTTIPVLSELGLVNITTDANGNGQVNVTVGDKPLYTFTVIQSAGNLNTRFNPVSATVCVMQPCDEVPPCNDDDCPPVVNPNDLQPDSEICATGPADAHLLPGRSGNALA